MSNIEQGKRKFNVASKVLIAVAKDTSALSKGLSIDKLPVLGYRIYDVANDTVTDYPYKTAKEKKALRDALEYGANEYQNIALVKGKDKTATVKTTNGAENRYSVLNIKDGSLYGTNKLIVYGTYNNGYGVVDYTGQRAEWSKEQTVAYAKLNGIANGKLVNKDSGVIISAITGEYRPINRDIHSVTAESKPTDALDEDLGKTDTRKNEPAPDFKVLKPEDLQPVIKPVKKPVIKPVEEVKPVKEEKKSEETPVEKKIESKRQENIFDEDFYEKLKPDFGGTDGVAILKYLIEIRNTPIEIFTSLREDGAYTQHIPALAAIDVLDIDAEKGYSSDVGLKRLLVRDIGIKSFNLVTAIEKAGVSFADVYDSPLLRSDAESEVFDNYVDGLKTDRLTVFFVENKLAGYLKAYDKELFGLNYANDTPLYYGKKIEVPGYEISGVNTDKIRITSVDKSEPVTNVIQAAK